MKKFLAALLGSSLVFGLAGCKIEILDNDEDNTEDKDEGNTDNGNGNGGDNDNGGGGVVTPQFETLQDALDYLNGDIGNCNFKSINDVYVMVDMDEDGTDDHFSLLKMDVTGSIDGNLSYNHSIVTDNMFGSGESESYSYVLTNEDGSTTTYVSDDNENWTIAPEGQGPESEDGMDFRDFTVADFEETYLGFVSTDAVTEEFGMEITIMLIDGNFVFKLYSMTEESFPMTDSEGAPVLDGNGDPIMQTLYTEMMAEMKDFGTVSLSLPTVTE